MDSLEEEFFLDSLAKSVKEGNAWSYKKSHIFIISSGSDFLIAYNNLKSEPLEDFHLLEFVIRKYPDLYLSPLGEYLYNLAFLYNRRSITKFITGRGSKVNLDINPYRLDMVKEWMQ